MVEFNGNGRAQNSAGAAPENAVLLVHRTTIWRDCFALSLESARFTVLQYPTIAAWLDVRGGSQRPGLAVICEPAQKDATMVVRLAKEMPTIIIDDGTADLDYERFLNEGVRGIIPNDTPFNIALNAIHVVTAGGTFVPAELLARKRPNPDFGGMLTTRQLEIVEALRQGKANKQIAHELNLCESTVKVHIHKIMRRLDARNRTEIAVLANELLEIARNSGNSHELQSMPPQT